MDIRNAFPSKFLKASNLLGRDVPVVMDFVSEEDVGDGTKKPILHFSDKKKGLVLNKINSDTISEAYGSETDEWVGQRILLFPSKTQFQGQTVDCIRVRIPLSPKVDRTTPQPEPSDAASFDSPAPTDTSEVPF